MKCKNCEAELEEGVSLCPSCGFDNTGAAPAEAQPASSEEETLQPAEEAAEQPAEEASESASEQPAKGPERKPGLSAGKVALLVALAVAATAVVVALIMGGMKKDEPAPTEPGANPAPTVETTEATIPADGNPDDATCKGTYYVPDEELAAALDTVVATSGDLQLTNAELQLYYWMSFYDFLDSYGQYVAGMGLNPVQSLDTQMSIQEGLTWQQFLLQGAIENWRNYATLSQKAEASGYEMPEDLKTALEKLPEELQKKAETYEYETAEAMIQADMGKGANLENYLKYMQTFYLGYHYFGSLMDQVELTDEMLESFFEEHAAEYEAKGLTKDTKFVDVRHILITPKASEPDETGKLVPNEAEWEACRAEAQALLDQYLAGEMTEDAFAALAAEHTEDPGSKQTGGLYKDVRMGQMVKPFEEWSFDASRQQGDTGLVKTDYGYHIMYFVSSRPAWKDTAGTDLMTEKSREMLEELISEHELEIDYSAIVLGTVDPASK